LIYLNISGMPTLERISEGTFAHLDSIEVITCKNNPNLTVFDLGSLKGLSHLRELDISNCGLKTLNLGLIDAVPLNEDGVNVDDTYRDGEFSKIRSLKLEGNPWHCDCELLRSLNLLVHHGSNDFHSDDEARCHTPYELAGTLLSDLSEKTVCLAAKLTKAPRIPGEDGETARRVCFLYALILLCKSFSLLQCTSPRHSCGPATSCSPCSACAPSSSWAWPLGSA
jgi:Leucine rich repeat